MNNVDYFTKLRFSQVLGLDMDKTDEVLDYFFKERLDRYSKSEITEKDLQEAHDDGYAEAEWELSGAVEDAVRNISQRLSKYVTVEVNGEPYIALRLVTHELDMELS